jgi:hypothetical protein
MSKYLVRFLYPLLGLAILAAISSEPLTAQYPGRSQQRGPTAQRQGRAEAGAGGQQQIQVPGPIKDFLGTTDEVIPPVPMTGVPAKAPTTDTYYYDRAVEDMLPDEFMSNPDAEFDWNTLKAWHVPPLLKSVRIIGPRRVEAGATIQYEAEVADPTATTTAAYLRYYGPKGRRSSPQATFKPIAEGSMFLRGTLKIPEHAEPGVYRHIRFGITNAVRSAKAYFSDYHPAMRGQPLEVEVLPNPNVDVIPPTMHWLRLGAMDRTDDSLITQPIGRAIPIYAHVTDNLSGVETVKLRMNKRDVNKFQEFELKPLMGQEDVYVGYLNVPKWWESGVYQVTTVTLEDKAGMQVYHYFATNEMVGHARVRLENDPEMVDTTVPQLISVWLDSETGTMGEPVTVSAIVIDDKSGVGTASAVFQSVPSYQNNTRVVLRKVQNPDVIMKSGFDTDLNLYRGELVTSVWQEPGRWQLMRFVARDNADNFLDMLPTQHPEFQGVAVEFGGGMRLREKILAVISDGAGAGTLDTMSLPAAAAPAAQPAEPGKIRRIDMIPPHPPRGACLNCHEP